MFSFESGTPIAIIVGGKSDGKIIYLKESNKIQNNIIGKCKCLDGCINKCGGKLNENPCCLCCNKEPINLNISKENPLYFLKNNLNHIVNKTTDNIEIHDEGIIYALPCLKNKDPDREYIAGPSGSGKSTAAARDIETLQMLKPEMKFVLFSRKDTDEVLDKLKPIRIPMDQKLIDEPMSAKDVPLFENSIVVFDDIDSSMKHDGKITEEVRNFRDLLLDKGRDKNIYVISIVHNITSGSNTKSSLLESTSITFFPHTDRYHIIRVLKEYCGCDSSTRDKILNLPTRAATIFKRYPQYCLYEKGIFLLNNNINK